LIGLFLAPAILLSSQPWSHPDPQKWTAADVDRLLAASPWAQQAGVTFGIKGGDDDPPPMQLPGAKEAGLPGSDQLGGRWDGGVGRPDRYSAPTLNVLVRWDSALPERQAAEQASKARKSGIASFTADQARQYYIISVIGLVPAGRYNQTGHTESESNSDNSVNARNPEEMLEQLMAYSRLVTKAGSIRAVDAKLDAASGDLHLFFPRDKPLTPNDKEVAFETRFGSVSLTKTFRLKDMTYAGKLEL
jgi:hypothetical protein